MKEIIELNLRLLAEAKAHLLTDGLVLSNNNGTDELSGLPTKLRDEITALQSAMKRVMPADFGYTLFLGDEEPSLHIEYENVQMEAGEPISPDWSPTESIIDQLRAFDWDAEREEAIAGTELMEEILERAKRLPVMIRPTKELQAMSMEEVSAYINEKRDDASFVHVLLWDGEDDLLDYDFDTIADFERSLPDLMTHMFHVMAVVADGKPLPVEKIDTMRKVALKELEDSPLAHAKASGKFEFIMAEMEAEDERAED